MVARRHHYVPYCYLNAFAVAHKRQQKPHLLAFDPIEAKCFRVPPDKAALETDFNTINLEGHPPDAFEQALASVESDIGPALVRIVEGEVPRQRAGSGAVVDADCAPVHPQSALPGGQPRLA